MGRKFFFVLFNFVIALINPITVNAQLTEADSDELLQKVDNAIGNLKTIIYKIEYSNKYLSRRDTIHTIAVCSLYIAPKDKMKAYSIVDMEFSELKRHTYGHRRYDGKASFWTNYPVDSLRKNIKPDIENNKQIRNSIVKNYSDMLLWEYLYEKKPFKLYRSVFKNLVIKDMNIIEENYKNIPVYIITLNFKDRDGKSDNIEKHYIRKSDFLPIAYSSFLRWESMEQYNYYGVDYLAINPNLTLDDFKIDKDETINAEERYKALKEKAKI